MNRCLGNEPIRRGNAKDARKERRQAEERKVVVKASRLSERELGSLRDQRLQKNKKWSSSSTSDEKETGRGSRRERSTHRDVVIKEKENPEDDSEWKRKPYPLSFEVPETNEPGASVRGLKRCAHGKRLRARSVETTPICHSRGRNEGERHAVVGTEPSHMPVE